MHRYLFSRLHLKMPACAKPGQINQDYLVFAQRTPAVALSAHLPPSAANCVSTRWQPRPQLACNHSCLEAKPQARCVAGVSPAEVPLNQGRRRLCFFSGGGPSGLFLKGGWSSWINWQRDPHWGGCLQNSLTVKLQDKWKINSVEKKMHRLTALTKFACNY